LLLSPLFGQKIENREKALSEFPPNLSCFTVGVPLLSLNFDRLSSLFSLPLVFLFLLSFDPIPPLVFGLVGLIYCFGAPLSNTLLFLL